jgi:aminopeptidase N
MNTTTTSTEVKSLTSRLLKSGSMKLSPSTWSANARVPFLERINTRLTEVLYMFTPAIGPLVMDKSATSLSVEPEGFNQTQELVSVVTYSKAPEFVRMVELILGRSKFHKALDKYHTDYSFGNVTSMDWIEEVSGMDLQNLAKTWLKRPGHPDITYATQYKPETKEFVVTMSQTGFEDKAPGNNGPWEIRLNGPL